MSGAHRGGEAEYRPAPPVPDLARPPATMVPQRERTAYLSALLLKLNGRGLTAAIAMVGHEPVLNVIPLGAPAHPTTARAVTVACEYAPTSGTWWFHYRDGMRRIAPATELDATTTTIRTGHFGLAG